MGPADSNGHFGGRTEAVQGPRSASRELPQEGRLRHRAVEPQLRLTLSLETWSGKGD